MFNKLLEERKEIFNKIDTSFDETLNSVVNKVSRSIKAGGNVYLLKMVAALVRHNI